jgi:hypothetical protein
MLLTFHVLISLDNLLPREPKLLLNRQLQVLSRHKPGNIIQLLLRPNHDTANNGSLAEGQRRDIRHLLLRARGKESDDSDDTAVGDSVDALGDGSGTTILNDDVNSPTLGDLEDFLGPLGVCLVVDTMVDAVGLLDVLQLLV